jgi:HAD superfamily hydrolase (TIGR01509 family)
MSTLRGVIFDIDGTLIDSNDAHAHAWLAALAEHGFEVPFDRIRRLIGMGGDKLLPSAIGVEKDSEQGRQISERRAAIFKQQFLPDVSAFPQVRPLIQRLRDDGLKLAVASSANGDELTPLLDRTGAADLFESATSSSDAPKSKPDPDIVQAALDRLGLPAEQVLMIGDTPYDIEAAARAGLGTIALRSGGWHDDELHGALAIYTNPADLFASYGDSPLAAGNGSQGR